MTYYFSGMDAAGSADGVRIVISFAELSRLSAVMASLAVEIGQHYSMFGAIGDAQVQQAFDHAEGDWNTERRKVVAFLDGARHSVDQALSAYQANEDAVAGVLSGHRG